MRLFLVILICAGANIYAGQTSNVNTNEQQNVAQTNNDGGDAQNTANQQANAPDPLNPQNAGQQQQNSVPSQLVEVIMYHKKDTATGSTETIKKDIEVSVNENMTASDIIGVVMGRDEYKEFYRGYDAQPQRVLFYQKHKDSKKIILKDSDKYPGNDVSLQFIEGRVYIYTSKCT